MQTLTVIRCFIVPPMNLFKTLAMVGLVLASTCRTSFGSTNQPTNQQVIRYQAYFYESDVSIPHDLSEINKRTNITIQTFPETTGKSGVQTGFGIFETIYPEYVKGVKDAKTKIQLGFSCSINGILDQDKIALVGKLSCVKMDTNTVTLDKTSLETSSKDLYFSQVIKIGGDVWFDVDPIVTTPLHPFAVFRIVPTLTP